MKRILFLISVSFLTFTNSFTQSLEEELNDVFNQLDSSKNVSAIQSASAQLELIAISYPEDYASNYYAAYSKAMQSYSEKESKKKALGLDPLLMPTRHPFQVSSILYFASTVLKQ
jgi:hypothetical protein